MKKIVEFPMEGTDQKIFVEVDVNEDDMQGIIPAAQPGEVIGRAKKTFEEAIENIKPAAATIIQKIRSLHDAPDEVEVQFGLKLSADAGAFIASTGIEANYAITLKWKKDPKAA